MDLEEYLYDSEERENRSMPFNPEIHRNIAVEITKGLAFVHSSSPAIVHCDLKPKNILISTDMRIKICDFGLAKLQQNSTLTTILPDQVAGTPLYMAPEWLLSLQSSARQKPEASGDIWSLGMTIGEMFAGDCLWEFGEGDVVDTVMSTMQERQLPKISTK